MKETVEKGQVSTKKNRKHHYVTFDDVLYLKKLLEETAEAILSNHYPGTRYPLTDDEKARYREQIKQYTFDIYGQSKSMDDMMDKSLCYVGYHFSLFKKHQYSRNHDKAMFPRQVISESASVSSKRVGFSSR